jgi:hypothetical protein
MLARQRRPRQHDKAHLAFVAERPCVICATNVGVDAHHIKMADARICKPQTSNIGMKSDDRYTLPLCREHHEQLHGMGERKFWGSFHVDACLLALCLYSCSVKGEAEEADRLITTASYALQALRRDDLV